MPRAAVRAGSSAQPAAVAPGLRLSLLGAATWTRGTTRPVALERRDAAVLAYLAIEGSVPRASVLDLLWPDAAPGAARNHLRQRLYRLKRAVGVELVEGAEVVSLAPGVAVDVRDVPPSAAAGELLPGLDYTDFPQFEAWLMQQRHRLRRAHCDDLAAQASRLEGQGRFAEAIALAERLVAHQPLEEHVHQRLMRLHYLRGDRAAAIAAFEHCERVIKDELGARPGPETLALLNTVESAVGVRATTPAATTPPSILRPPRLIGRETELATLVGAWSAHRVPLVVGAGGLGKTRLLQEFGAHVDGHVAVRARPGDATVPYALLARWLRALEQRDAQALADVRPELLAVLLPERAMTRSTQRVSTAAIRSACERVLATSLRRGLAACILDDLHCADAASLELFGHLMLTDGLETCRWGLARRPGEDAGPAAATLDDALAHAGRLVVVKLAPLDQRRIAELVDSLALPDVDGAELAASLARHTGGNPLFVLETLKQAVQGGGLDGRQLPRPLAVVESIERRVATLSPQAQSLLQLAAAAAADFSVKLAETALGTTALALADAWRELESAQLIDGDAFVHDLVHEAVLNRVPKPILRHLHATIAGCLAGARGEPARIADLWLAAGDDAHAAPMLVAAADAARRAGRFIEAGERSEQAARAYDRLRQDAQAFEQLYRGFDDFTTHASRTVYERIALELDRRAHTDRQRAMAAIARAQVATLAGDWNAMEGALVEALGTAQRCGDRELEAEARFGLGVLSHSRAAFGEGVEQIMAAVQLLDAVGAGVRQAEMRGSLARVLYVLGRVAEASAQIDEALPVLRHDNVTNELAADVGFRALLALEVGDVDEALDLGAQSCRLLEHAEAGPHEWLTALGDRVRVLATASRYGEALELIRAARADRRFERVPSQVRLVETEAGILFELGRGWLAERLLEPLAGVDGGVAGYRGSRAVLALHGQSLQARPVTAASLDTARALVSGVPQRCRYATLAAPHLPAPAALQLCAPVLELAESLGLKGHLPGLLASQADALQRSDQGEEARRCALRAVRLLESTTPLVYRASLWLRLHGVLTALGDATTAHEVLLQATEWIHRTARRNVPPEYRDSFLARNAVNRELLLRAIRADIAPVR